MTDLRNPCLRGVWWRDRVDALVAEPAGNRARRDDCGDLDGDLGAQGRSPRRDQAAAAAAEERRERGRKGHDTQRPGDRVAARAQAPARAEEQRLDRRNGHAEHFGDLRVAAVLDLAHHDRGTLVEGKPRQRREHLVERQVFVVLGSGRLRGVLQRNLVGPPTGLPPAHPADVVRDLDQPVVGLRRLPAALEGAIGVQEGLLRDVFGVRRVSEHGQRVLVDLGDVLTVEALEGVVERLVAVQHSRREPAKRSVFPDPGTRRVSPHAALTREAAYEIPL